MAGHMRGDFRSGGLGPGTGGLICVACLPNGATAGESSCEHRPALCGGRPASAEPPRTLSTAGEPRLASIFFGMVSQHATQPLRASVPRADPRFGLAATAARPRFSAVR